MKSGGGNPNAQTPYRDNAKEEEEEESYDIPSSFLRYNSIIHENIALQMKKESEKVGKERLRAGKSNKLCRYVSVIA